MLSIAGEDCKSLCFAHSIIFAFLIKVDVLTELLKVLQINLHITTDHLIFENMICEVKCDLLK